MPIRLDNLKKEDPKVTIDEQTSRSDISDSYTYKDISFDLEYNTDRGSINNTSSSFDLQQLTDAKDIKQSLTNMFNTAPGQRHTNPEFGLNLSRFLFDPMSKITADLIGRAILEGINTYEPRVVLDHLDVIGYDSWFKRYFQT